MIKNNDYSSLFKWFRAKAKQKTELPVRLLHHHVCITIIFNGHMCNERSNERPPQAHLDCVESRQ